MLSGHGLGHPGRFVLGACDDSASSKSGSAGIDKGSGFVRGFKSLHSKLMFKKKSCSACWIYVPQLHKVIVGNIPYH